MAFPQLASCQIARSGRPKRLAGRGSQCPRRLDPQPRYAPVRARLRRDARRPPSRKPSARSVPSPPSAFTKHYRTGTGYTACGRAPAGANGARCPALHDTTNVRTRRTSWRIAHRTDKKSAADVPTVTAMVTTASRAASRRFGLRTSMDPSLGRAHAREGCVLPLSHADPAIGFSERRSSRIPRVPTQCTAPSRRTSPRGFLRLWSRRDGASSRSCPSRSSSIRH